jgi:hypothetical protein
MRNRIWIRIRIKVKEWIRIRIKVKQIHNIAFQLWCGSGSDFSLLCESVSCSSQSNTNLPPLTGPSIWATRLHWERPRPSMAAFTAPKLLLWCGSRSGSWLSCGSGSGFSSWCGASKWCGSGSITLHCTEFCTKLSKSPWKAVIRIRSYSIWIRVKQFSSLRIQLR